MKTIFVSSTFRDMQFERDCLNTQVLPRINEIAKKYGDSVALCDLRWGINTYSMSIEQSNKKILGACLREIDNCRPYMIVFLGERYGWMPGKQLIKHTLDDYSQIDLLDYDISLTALEIEYGALLDPDQFSHTLFYFRENNEAFPEDYSESDISSHNKLTALKNKIKSFEGAHVYTYELNWNAESEKPEGLKELANKIISDVSTLMIEEWKETANLTEFEREKRIHWLHAQKNSAVFYERHTKLDLCEYLLNNHQPFYFIIDEAGKGKTTLLSKLACNRAQEGINVLPVFCGLTTLSSNQIKITKYIISYLKETFGSLFKQFDTEIEGDINYWKSQFALAMSICSQIDAKIELFFDDIDLLNTDNIMNLPFFCENIPPNVSLVFSCDSRKPLPKEIPYLHGISSPDYFDTKHIMENHLTEKRKELDDTVLQEIFRKKDSTNPLYLKMILQRLTLLNRTDFYQIAENGGDISEIINYQKKIVSECPHSLEEMCIQLVEVVCERINPDLGKYITDYIFASYKGVSEKHLKRLLEEKGIQWIPLDFRIIIQLLEGLIILRDNEYYDLSYNRIKPSFKIKSEIYTDLMRLIEEKNDISDEEAAAYTYYCLRSENYSAYLQFLLIYPDIWDIIANTTFNILQYKFHFEMNKYSLKDFMERWIRNLLNEAELYNALEILKDFFQNNYNKACLRNVYFWRVMAKEMYGDWNIVNKIQYRPEEYSNELSPIYSKKLHDLIKRWENLQKNNQSIRRYEHLVRKEFREYEFEIEGHKFYFFNVPRQKDSQLFFMKDNCILLTFYRSSVGDHCTYDVIFDKESGILTVVESEFCHYDVESYISFYKFDNSLSTNPKCQLFHECRSGCYNLPLHFTIK